MVKDFLLFSDCGIGSAGSLLDRAKYSFTNVLWGHTVTHI